MTETTRKIKQWLNNTLQSHHDGADACVFPESPKDWGTPTGDFIISDGEKVIIAHHEANEDEDEWTEIDAEYELKKKGAINTSEIPDEIKTEIIVAWILENVDASDVPADEGNDEALLYNLVHLAQDGKEYEQYAYKPHQDKEIKSWEMKMLTFP